ncbi:MAG TPA: hypothetical protein VK465_18250 [Fibrobacteria bacterium]|nr:hypothetical protein [Fibrobacteria bacterium]
MKPQGPLPPAVPASVISDLVSSQAGGGILGVVAMVGVTFALVQGSLFYRAKSSVRFQAKEQNKVLAQQVAEAGVEENIADLGRRHIRPTMGMKDHVTYAGQSLGAGVFTTTLTTVAIGSDADTVDLTSQGRVASTSQEVRARLRLKRYMDTTRTPILTVKPEVTMVPYMRQEVTYTEVVQDPNTMPALNETPAYTACMSSSEKKCNVCHIPNGNPDNRHVIDVSKAAINTHVDHHGDYVTTDGTCDIYNPRKDSTVTEVPDFKEVIVEKTVEDIVEVIDTVAKVQILSWK